MLSPVPWARHILGWMFKAEEFGTKQLLRQLKAANVLSYAAVEDIITTGIVCLSACSNAQQLYVYQECSTLASLASSTQLPLCLRAWQRRP